MARYWALPQIYVSIPGKGLGGTLAAAGAQLKLLQAVQCRRTIAWPSGAAIVY